jgi:hypothetical protein
LVEYARSPIERDTTVELREFVERAIGDAVAGVAASHEVVKQHGGEVYSDGRICMIDLDVAVTVAETTAGTNQGGIKVWGVGAGIDRHAESSNTSVSRIKFQVPVKLPATEPRHKVSYPSAKREGRAMNGPGAY